MNTTVLSLVSELVSAHRIAPAQQAKAAAALGIADLSLRPRYGCKGPGAAAWLESQGLTLPETPNSWLPLAGDALVARLGFTEYLVDGDPALVARLAAAPRVAGVYPVLREDACLLLGGAHLEEVLRQTCNVNFRPLDLAVRPLVLTTMVGVGVTAIPEQVAGQTRVRLWCDGSYGHYLWETLHGIALELGGGAVDSSSFTQFS